ncbi:hypothetical protein DS901_05110 [Loktanella sp. D2R18]|uniref:copper chaperone PCu(A)C n=1 Tax=Rhodobacterales TaxID=204455 RepID=UPI000DEB1582|nr:MULTISPECIES: copper chaperone PCu(A)C [Rhodobacterales]MDO6590760.1 copper chaperone PCu(A)C [Yoonia sp. 1_MG-2023]RBW44624.1 hypothetical protein DS901_05110 [Loktanella sp. D2R18]
MKLNTLINAAIFSLTASVALAESEIHVMDTMVFETAPTAMAGGGFMQIMNHGDTDDMLIDVRADYPRVEIHTTEFADGVAKMIHIEGVPVPAGGMATLEPGGFHVMFMGLQGTPFVLDEMIPATLVFEYAGEVEVMFKVVARGEHGNMNHGEMNH